MRNVEIEIFPIAKTQVATPAVRAWLDSLGVSSDYVIPNEEIITDPALLIALAAKRCYKSFEPSLNPNVTKVRTDWAEYLDNILKSGHGSVLEHGVWTFAIEGVSRVFTGEMNRHRAGVGISEASMRYIRYTDIPWWLPTSITLTPEEEELKLKVDDFLSQADVDMSPEEYASNDAATQLMIKKVRSRNVFDKHMAATEKHYAELQSIWEKELAPDSKFTAKKHITSMMRRIIPMGVATGGVWTMNLRAVRHVLALRASEAAEEEILHVFSRIGKIMTEKEPMLFGDFKQTNEGYWVPQHKKV